MKIKSPKDYFNFTYYITMKLKDYIIKILLFVIWAGLAAYTVWLYLGDKLIVASDAGSTNLIAYIFVLMIGLFLLGIIIKPSLLPNNRRGVLLLGIGIIRASHAYLLDNPSQMVYLQDIMKLVWVFLCITGPMKLLMSEKHQQQVFEQEVEVIEV